MRCDTTERVLSNLGDLLLVLGRVRVLYCDLRLLLRVYRAQVRVCISSTYRERCGGRRYRQRGRTPEERHNADGDEPEVSRDQREVDDLRRDEDSPAQRGNLSQYICSAEEPCEKERTSYG